MRVLLSLLLLCVVPCAFAATQPGAEPFISEAKLQPSEFDAFAAELRSEMDPPGRFEWVKEDERIKVLKALDEMGRILEGHASVAELRETDKVALINAQEVANAILTKRDKERLICERRKIVGSQMPQSVCETYGEKMMRTADAKKRYREMEQVILPKN
jgi:hypothetical protein